MADTTLEHSTERPYKPSLIDRFTDWVDGLPVKWWVFYAGLGIVLVLIQLPFLWWEGGQYAEELLPIVIFNGLATSSLFAMIHLFDSQAVTALHVTRPALEITETEFDEFQYRLSAMPFLVAMLPGLLLVVIVILMEQVSITPVRYAALEQLPLFSIVYQTIDKASAFMYGVIFYHTIRQLRLVNTIYTNHLRISLFNLGPSQAFSRLTTSTAVGLLVGVHIWMLINPDLLANPVSVAFSGLITVLTVIVFVWPLLGAHRLIEAEKTRMLGDIDLQFEAVFAKFNQRFREDDYAAIESLNATIASLEIQHRRIAEIPTWPWKPETARFALTAIAFPLLLTILQFFVAQALGW